MLATLYRRTGRYDEASKQLDRLERLDNASKWRGEIQQERSALMQLANSTEDIDDDAGTDVRRDALKEELDDQVPQT